MEAERGCAWDDTQGPGELKRVKTVESRLLCEVSVVVRRGKRSQICFVMLSAFFFDSRSHLIRDILMSFDSQNPVSLAALPVSGFAETCCTTLQYRVNSENNFPNLTVRLEYQAV